MNIETSLAQSFNKDFCIQLEYHLTRTLKELSNNKFERLWCDGVKEPLHEPNKNAIILGQVVTEAYIGLDGQDVYQMIIKLGPSSLEKFTVGLNLINELPSEDHSGWLVVDPEEKKIQIELN